MIMTPYFIIDDTMLKALTLAARNGVKIKIFTPHIPDKKIVFRVTRSYYYTHSVMFVHSMRACNLLLSHRAM